MDIKHVVNATAAITLGKDMVFRDYVQGAYRMRGIGMGQKIDVFIIPEVVQLMQRELKLVTIPVQREEHVLEDVVAWLLVNSLRSEQIQWTMLCVQNIGNLYRKTAFKCIHRNTKYFVEGGKRSEQLLSDNTQLSASSSAAFLDQVDKDQALEVFNESIDFSLETSAPNPVSFAKKLLAMLTDNAHFLTPEQMLVGKRYYCVHHHQHLMYFISLQTINLMVILGVIMAG